MKYLNTSIEINAPVEKVWEVLTNFTDYPKWNPFIKSLKGRFEVGEVLFVTLQVPDSKPMNFSPRCFHIEKNKRFSWKGKFLIPGLFDGTHSFKMEALDSNRTNFIQEEKFSGILVPFFWNQIQHKTRTGFEMMNVKLKEEVEDFH